MNGDMEDQQALVTAIRAALEQHGRHKLSIHSMIGILRTEVAWLELQMTRGMAAELEAREAAKL